MVQPADIRSPSDLHLHSDHSDGTQSPAELMAAARAEGLGTVALTDHDTTSGWAEASLAALSVGLTLLPGMELSARHQWRSVHVLGYLFDPDDAALRSLTGRIRSSRLDRAAEMARRMGRDFDLTWEDILAQTAPGATVGRPHLADALVAKGIVRDRGEAFAGILHPASEYYVSLYAPDAVTAVAAIADAGGVPVVAHPAGRSEALPPAVLDSMRAVGLAGLELGHRDNREPELGRLADYALRHDLIVTGSSDYHGSGKPNRLGENTTSPEMVARIIDRARARAPVRP